jgi:hypothetical protein
MSKPYKGSISFWKIEIIPEGKYISGVYVDHPTFAGRMGHTSLIVNMKDMEEYWEVETLNSHYRLYYDDEREEQRKVLK